MSMSTDEDEKVKKKIELDSFTFSPFKGSVLWEVVQLI